MNCFCEKCEKSMDEGQFYTYRDGTKVELCKKCLTMHIDNFDPSTYVWLLEKMDVPYVPSEWNALREKVYSTKPPNKINGMSVFGRYLSKMKLKQWKDYHWSDTEELQAEDEKKRQAYLDEHPEVAAREAQLTAQFEQGLISEAQYQTFMRAEEMNKKAQAAPVSGNVNGVNGYAPGSNPFIESNFIPEEELANPAAELTKDDKIYLAMKWGRTYQPSEWIELESKYNEMMNSFDIQDSDTIGTLILTCKTYLKMNQALDCGDIDGYQKLSRVYESLRKSAKFTAAQNKEEKNDFVDCIGEMVAYCEKNGGQIPKMVIDTPNDVVDKIIMDLKEYTRSLIYEDKSLAQQIENYIKKRENADAMKKDKQEAREKGLDEVPIEDEDFRQHFENIAADKEADAKIYSGEEGK